MKKNYIPGSMSFSEGFMSYKCAGISKDKFMEVDENKALEMVKSLLKEGRKIYEATLGLDGDWIENSTVIYDGEFNKYDSYHGSLWATPILIISFEDGPSETYECYSYKTEIKVGEYDVEFEDGQIVVGCQIVSKDLFLKIGKKANWI